MAVPDVQGRVLARLMTACGVAVEEVEFFNDSRPGIYVALWIIPDVSSGHFSAPTWLSRFSLPTMIMM